MGALCLAQLARQRHGGETAIGQPRGQAGDHGTGIGKNDGIGSVIEPQHVDDGRVDIVVGHGQRAVFDIAVLAFLGGRGHAHRVFLIRLREFRDGRRYGGRKHQGTAAGRGLVEDEFEIFAETQIQHFVGFVQNDGLDIGQINRVAHDMVTQPPRRGDNDLRAAFQAAFLIAEIHAADARGQYSTGAGIQPLQFAFDLQGQFARWCDDQGERAACGAEQSVLGQDGRADGQAKAHRLARSGLCRDQQILIGNCCICHRHLHGCEVGIALGGQGGSKGRDHRRHQSGAFWGFVNHAPYACLCCLYRGLGNLLPRWTGASPGPRDIFTPKMRPVRRTRHRSGV